MTAATGAATVQGCLPRPLRALLLGLLLRGLRARRRPHAPGWDEASPGQPGQPSLMAFQVRGTRGQTLAAWLALPPAASARQPVPVVVGVHGWGANASMLAPLVGPLARAGIAVALFDAANHGDSSAEAFSSLPRFAEDLAAVLVTLKGMPAINAGRVGLLGHSVGAAAVLLHAARVGGVQAVVSLSAFAHPREVMERWLQEHHIPRRWIGTAILDHVQDVIGERFDAIAPLHQLPHIACPVLLVHGAQDATVPLSDAHRLHGALRQGDLLVVDGDHDLRAALQPHSGELVRFLASNLRGTAAPAQSLPHDKPGPHPTVLADVDIDCRAPGCPQRKPTMLVIDVRSEREFQSTALQGAINLPLSQLQCRIREMVADPTTPLALYCASGGRSGIACTMLQQMGYTEVSNAGGLYTAAASLQLDLRR